MAEIDSSLVFRGVWTDWSRGRVMGLTLTTDITAGNLIIAFVAILVQVASGYLWNLICFVLHQISAHREKGHRIFQQEQAILRTQPPARTLFVTLLNLRQVWSPKGWQLKLDRGIPIMALCVLFDLAALTASIFSSYAVSTSNVPVLALRNNCAVDIDIATWFTAPNLPGQDTLIALGPTALKHVQECYGSATTPSSCRNLLRPRFDLSRNSTRCPFKPTTICALGDSDAAAITLDTNLLDSHDVFGVNAAPRNRISLQRRTTFVPLSLPGHFTVMKYARTGAREVFPGEEAFCFQYGPSHVLADPVAAQNCSLLWSSYVSNITNTYEVRTLVNHGFDSLDWASEFTPRSELHQENADLQLILIYSNAMRYYQPVDDPVFSAHTPLFYCTNDAGHDCVAASNRSPRYDTPFYKADNPAGVVAGITQYQFCLSDDSDDPISCTPLGAHPLGRVESLLPGANEVQLATLKLMSSVSFLYDAAFAATVSGVLISSQTSTGYQWQQLPADRWIDEVTRFELTSLTTIQQFIASHSYLGTPEPGVTLSPNTSGGAYLCDFQKVMKTGGLANTNVFAFAFTITTCIFLILLDSLLFRILVFASKFQRALAPRIDRWVDDGMLQLQRRAYEAQGVGPWRRLHKEVPTLLHHRDIPTLPSSSSVNGSTSTSTLTPTSTSRTTQVRIAKDSSLSGLST